MTREAQVRKHMESLIKELRGSTHKLKYLKNDLDQIEDAMNAPWCDHYRIMGIIPYFDSPAVNVDIEMLRKLKEMVKEKSDEIQT